MAHIGATCIDMYEASLLEIRDDGTEAPFSPYSPPNGHKVRAVSSKGVVPQAHISMIEARRACEASSKRLCRPQEWKAACKGPESTRFPYGNTRVAGACVDTNRTSPMNLLHNGERNDRTLNDPRANQQERTLEHAGALESCTNGYGVHDMVGNVHEWTDDGSFRGGYYLDTKLNGEGCDYRTTAHARDYYDYSTGFRCCADAEFSAPSTIAVK
jgi:formylglycine-generating enzyme required for sulfatase activity